MRSLIRWFIALLVLTAPGFGPVHAQDPSAPHRRRTPPSSAHPMPR